MQLTPPAEDAAALLARMCEEPWPTTEAERLPYFDHLGLRDASELEAIRDHADSSSRPFTTSLAGEVGGTCSIYCDQLIGLALFCYSEPIANGARAREGFAGIRDHLSRVLGATVEEWGPANEPACLWRSGPLHLDMYCFQRGTSSVMVGAGPTRES